MKLTGKTRDQINAELQVINDKAVVDAIQQEVNDELQDILRSIALEKYIEKQKGI